MKQFLIVLNVRRKKKIIIIILKKGLKKIGRVTEFLLKAHVCLSRFKDFSARRPQFAHP